MHKLVLKHISKSYGSQTNTLTDINLTVDDQEFIVIVGPSGCGKSTLLRMIAGLETVSSGEIYLEDRLVNMLQPKDRDIAMVFQNYSLYPHMNVYQNMAFGLRMQKKPKKEIEERVREAAAILDLVHLLDRKPKALSGGQMQRVALGRAIVRQPKLFLFDEPLSNLDARLRISMRKELIKLHRQLSATSIYVTHDQTEAMSMATRLVVLRNGNIQQSGRPMDIYDNPDNVFVGGFLGNPPMNFFPAKVERSKDGAIRLDASFMKIKLLPAQKEHIHSQGILPEVVLGVRPEDIQLNTNNNVPRHGRFHAQVSLTEELGSDTLVTLTAGGLDIVARTAPRAGISAGATVSSAIPPEAIKIFNKESGKRIC